LKALFSLLSLLATLYACATATPPGADLSIMTFNVQNLFDTIDDPGKDDKAYLPIEAKRSRTHVEACRAIEVQSWQRECLELDWDEALLAQKLSAIADAIRQVEGGPDIIAFQEVEHAALLERLRNGYLADLGYRPAILTEGSDQRGIDVGFLSKLPLADDAVLHPLRFPGHADREADTRGILEATFELPDGRLLTGFAVHFPAPFHPTRMREQAYEQLNVLLDALPEHRAAFAAGDFNTPSREARDTGIFERLVHPYWTVVHETECTGDCRGTYYYARDDDWSFLDMILFSPGRSGNATGALRAKSARVANLKARHRTNDDTPAGFDPALGSGVSDHWPLVIELDLKQKQ
jgi:endonuclease/exonuclease/phosphatase family metal-dependent hydrolase